MDKHKFIYIYIYSAGKQFLWRNFSSFHSRSSNFFDLFWIKKNGNSTRFTQTYIAQQELTGWKRHIQGQLCLRSDWVFTDEQAKTRKLPSLFTWSFPYIFVVYLLLDRLIMVMNSALLLSFIMPWEHGMRLNWW